jgi:sugar O-acyltransferase (sialic acid O-acetyltransferase NeuD family)
MSTSFDKYIGAEGTGVLLWVIGAGGHAKVVVDTIRAAGFGEPAGVLDDDPAKYGTTVLGVPVLGGPDPETIARLGITRAVIAIGHNHARSQIAERLHGLVTWETVVHPAAVVAASARLGEGTVIFAGVVIQPDAVIGRHAIVNTSASVDHDCEIGAFAHIAPGVRIAGGVLIGDGALLGIGSCVTPGRRIREWATVGAGAVVIDDVAAFTTAVGVPARPMTVTSK